MFLKSIPLVCIPQRQKLAKERRESETQRMKMRTTTMRTMIKSKTRAYRVTVPLPQTEKSPFYNSHHLCNLHLTPSPPTLSSVVGQDCTGWVGRVELPPPHFTRPDPTLKVLRQPPLSIPQFHCPPSLCIPV